MKKGVLFVDDEEMVLQGLQRSMRAMRNDWDMTFVNSGAKALAFLEKTPVDVVVSDMRMPGMNGAQLFAEVAKRFPKSVIFAGQLMFSRDLIFQRLFHNQTAFSLQRRLHWDGVPMVILPTRVR